MYTCVQVTLSSKGTPGKLEVTLPSNQLQQAVTQEPNIHHDFPYKFIKAALTGVAGLKADLRTKVAIDANGMLQVCNTMHKVVGTTTSQNVQAVSLDCFKCCNSCVCTTQLTCTQAVRAAMNAMHV